MKHYPIISGWRSYQGVPKVKRPTHAEMEAEQQGLANHYEKEFREWGPSLGELFRSYRRVQGAYAALVRCEERNAGLPYQVMACAVCFGFGGLFAFLLLGGAS